MKKNKKITLIGCGLFNITLGRHLADDDWDVTIIEKESYIGGHCHDYINDDGVLVQKYGPHIFNTNSEKAYQFLMKHAPNDWVNFNHSVKGLVLGNIIPIPFNFEGVDFFYDKERAKSIKNKLKKTFGEREKITIGEMLDEDDHEIKSLSNFIFTNIFKNYTEKMWGRKVDDIDPSVLKRVPINLGYHNSYFNSKYQLMPKYGYTKFLEKVLDHKRINVILKKDFFDIYKIVDNSIYFKNNNISSDLFVYTGSLDYLFNYQFGIIPYRSLEFKLKTVKVDKYQEKFVINYPSNKEYTRITDYGFINVSGNKPRNLTTIGYEFPGEYNPNSKKWNKPYYPISTKEGKEIYFKYLDLSNKIKNLLVGGRLGLYKYFNMDATILNAIDLAKSIIENEK